MDAAEPAPTTIKGEETVVHRRARFAPPPPAELAAQISTPSKVIYAIVSPTDLTGCVARFR